MSLMIEGGRRLSGDLTVQGAKNSVLPILAACILSGDVCVLQRCPHLEDVDTSIDILRHLGCAVRWNGPDLEVDSSTLTRWDIPDRLMRRMGLERQALGAVCLDDDIVGQCAERAERQFRRREFPTF